jgi:hypothetical protein
MGQLHSPYTPYGCWWVRSIIVMLRCMLCVTPQCMEVYQVLWRDLQRRDLLVMPKVHISPSCGHQEQRLREYVRRLQGQLAESPGVI